MGFPTSLVDHSWARPWLKNGRAKGLILNTCNDSILLDNNVGKIYFKIVSNKLEQSGVWHIFHLMQNPT